MIYVGIDPATKCGFAALREDGRHITSGMWQLKGRGDTPGRRFAKLQDKLSCLLDELGTAPEDIVLGYEVVARHKGTKAAHIYGGLLASLFMWCDSVGIEYQGVAVGTIKKTATGKGNATKFEMLSAANEHWSLDCFDDNEADALWIAEHVRRNYR